MKNNSYSLFINNLSVSVATSVDTTATAEDKQVLHSVNLIIAPGTVHAIMGPNGSGKSTLAYALMGHPRYTITSGAIVSGEIAITDLSPDKRAQWGLFLAFQHPCEIPGVSVSSFLRESYCVITGTMISVLDFQALLLKRMAQLRIDPIFASRGLNEGFSGGEKKRLEMLQLLVLQPKIAILDEIDSGLDVDALKMVAAGIELARQENPAMAIILITHYQRILQYIVPDCVHVLRDGKICMSGDARLAERVEKEGYQDNISFAK